MDFTTLKFLVFLGVIAVTYRLVPKGVRPAFVLLASYAFYWTWSGKLAVLLLTATAGAYLAARILHAATTEQARRTVMILAVAMLVGLLAFYKTAFLWSGSRAQDILIPLGISYFTFKLISYVVDVYWGVLPAETDFIAFAAYSSFFPQIVAGPIQRSQPFLHEIHAAKPAGAQEALTGIQRILLGYFKKFVVANNLGMVVDYIYNHIYGQGTPLALGFYLYPLQLYADFSGLTDIAVGAALLLGMKTPENFNAPFSAGNISVYWRRWHISLTTWLTDYVFSPLRVVTRDWGRAGLVFSLTVNLVLIGLWHRLSWPFFCFGLLHAFYLSVEALSAKTRKRFYRQNPSVDQAMKWLGPIATFHLVAIGMVFVRGQTLDSIFYLLAHMANTVTSRVPAKFSTSLWIGLAAYALTEIADWFRRRDAETPLIPAMPQWGRWSVYFCTGVTTVLVLMLLLSGGRNRNPFLYAIF